MDAGEEQDTMEIRHWRFHVRAFYTGLGLDDHSQCEYYALRGVDEAAPKEDL